MFQLARKKHTERKSVYSDGQQTEKFTWVPYEKKFETRLDAKRSFFGCQAVDEKWSDDMVNEQFKRYVRNIGGTKVVKAE